MGGESRLCIVCSPAMLNTTVCRIAALRRGALHLVWRGGFCWRLLSLVSFIKRGPRVWACSSAIPVRASRFGLSHLTARPIAPGERRRTLVNHHPRPRVAANVSSHRTIVAIGDIQVRSTIQAKTGGDRLSLLDVVGTEDGGMYFHSVLWERRMGSEWRKHHQLSQ